MALVSGLGHLPEAVAAFPRRRFTHAMPPPGYHFNAVGQILLSGLHCLSHEPEHPRCSDRQILVEWLMEPPVLVLRASHAAVDVDHQAGLLRPIDRRAGTPIRGIGTKRWV